MRFDATQMKQQTDVRIDIDLRRRTVAFPTEYIVYLKEEIVRLNYRKHFGNFLAEICKFDKV